MTHRSLSAVEVSVGRETGSGAPNPIRRRTRLPLLLCWLGVLCSADGLAQDATELQTQIEQQRAENQALKAKIEKFEQVLKTDVCKNPEAAKLLEEEPAASSTAPPPVPAKGE